MAAPTVWWLLVLAASAARAQNVPHQIREFGNTADLAMDAWDKTFKGEFVLKGTTFFTQCRCRSVRQNIVTQAFPRSKCRPPQRFSVVQNVVNPHGFRRRVVEELVGRPDDMRLVNIRATGFSCVDGRDPVDDLTLRTPGGDFAELLYLLSEYELFQRTELHQASVDAFLVNWLQFSPRSSFSFHTDEAAADKIRQVLVAELNYPDTQPLDLARPPPDMQERTLDLLTQPENQGNLHIRLMMTHPDRYRVSLEGARYLIRSFFQILWNKNRMGVRTIKRGLLRQSVRFRLDLKLRLVVKVGKRQEGAWLDVVGATSCLDEEVFPLFAPHHDYSEVPFRLDPTVTELFGTLGNYAKHSKWEDVKHLEEEEDRVRRKLARMSRKLTPKSRKVLVNHLKAVEVLRWELAEFMAQLRSANPVVVYSHLMDIGNNALYYTRQLETRTIPAYTVELE